MQKVDFGWVEIMVAATTKLLLNALDVYFNTGLETPAFTGDPACIRTLASSPLHVLMSFVPMFPVCVNFTLHVLIFYVYLVSQKTRNYLCQH